MIDWNVHLPCGSENLEHRWSEERTMEGSDLIRCFEVHLPTLKKDLVCANFMVFNPSIDYHGLEEFCSHVRRVYPNAHITILGDIFSEDPVCHVRRLYDAGVNSLKFHCYFQYIEESNYKNILNLCIAAKEFKMPIFLDTSYGSLDMYRFDNLRLASYILKEINDIPVILLHSGGARILEAFLLADCCPNVFLDTSFSIPYYLGSSIEKDFAFAYKKIGVDRVLYGSDFPYISLDDSISKTREFFIRNDFSELEIETIFSNSFA